MESRKVLKLFLASSSDVKPERKIVHEVVEAWNRSIGAGRGWQVDVFDYNTHASPDYGSDAQDIINRKAGNMSHYTFFVGILKHRFGTPTPRYPSGTNEEFNRAVKAYEKTQRLRIKLYFCTAPIPHNADLEQKQKVRAFRKKVEPLSLLWDYRTLLEFRKYFGEHFNGWMEEQMREARRAASAPKRTTPKPPAAPKVPPSTSPKLKATRPKTTPPVNTPRETAKKTARKKPASRASATVSSSGSWLFLDERILRCRPVKGTGNQLVLEILSRNGEEESFLRHLSDARHYHLLSYAHGHDAGQVRLDSCEHQSDGLCEDVLKLKLGPVKNKVLRVHF